jgi:hypothetical protein
VLKYQPISNTRPLRHEQMMPRFHSPPYQSPFDTRSPGSILIALSTARTWNSYFSYSPTSSLHKLNQGSTHTHTHTQLPALHFSASYSPSLTRREVDTIERRTTGLVLGRAKNKAQIRRRGKQSIGQPSLLCSLSPLALVSR